MTMTMSALYSTNMFSSIFKCQLTGQHNTGKYVRSFRTHCPDFELISLCSYYLMSRVQRRSNKYRFNSHWFDPTGDRTTNHYTTDQVHCLIGQSSSTYLKKTDSCVNVMFDHWIQLSIVLPSKSRLVLRVIFPELFTSGPLHRHMGPGYFFFNFINKMCIYNVYEAV